MNCSRCEAKAVVRRGEAVYCGKCAMARDWEEVIQFIQTERVARPSNKPIDSAPAPAAAARPTGQDGQKTRPARRPESGDQAPAESSSAPGGPPADPFA